MNRRRLVSSAPLLLVAMAVAGLRPATALSAGLPDEPPRQLYAALEAAMRTGLSTPFRQRFDALAPAVDQVFDLQAVLKLSVGPRWNGMAPALRARLFRDFRRFTIATYVANFDKYDGERFQILPGSRDSGPDRIIDTEIVRQTGQRMRVDYVMRNASGAWRAVDVLLDGTISRVAVQRSDFRRVLATGAAEALIANLRRKIADLSDGALNS